MQSLGLDYGNNRTDFEYGSPLSNSLRFHVGGFTDKVKGLEMLAILQMLVAI